VDILRRLLDGLGTPGAARNAEHALLAHAAEDRAIAALVDRLGALDVELRPAA
jgi:hypothetical protein